MRNSPHAAELFERHCVLMAAADEAQLHELYHDDAFYYDPLSGKLEGSREIAPYLASIGRCFDSLTVVVQNSWTFNEHAVVEWIQTQSRGGETGKQRGTCILLSRDGALAEHRDYFTLGRPPAAEALRAELVLPER